jgi:hypothetical protein
MRHFVLTTALALTAASITTTVATSDVHACGGCFAPSQTVQVVTDHRMVMAIHPDEAFLWDQIRFTGNPADFAWVLPVSGNVTVDVAESSFFDVLDASTAINVQGPIIRTTCGGGGGGLGAFANSPSARGAEDQSTDAGVTVISMQTVGPYETVTLRSTDAMSLTTWLQSHSYAIPDSIQPTIQYYIDHHSDFVALRLAPGEGVQAMQPIRIHYDSANTTLPLRMVSAGISDKVGISLWVFASGRMESMNYANATIDQSQLAWDWDTNSSNYAELFDSTLAATAGGRAWITETTNQAGNYGLSDTMASDDWRLATRGTFGRGNATWITRMRTNLLARFLDGDLVLQASAADAPIANIMRTQLERGTRPVPNCPSEVVVGSGGNGVTCSVSRVGDRRSRSGNTAGLAFAALGLAAFTMVVLRARRRRLARRDGTR